MEAKEKSKELIHKYKPLCGGYWGGKINKEFAKQCALIAVDEIIDTAMTGYLVNDSKVAEFQIKMRDYWNEVKTEINNIT